MKIICNYEGHKNCNFYVILSNIAFPSNDWDDFGLSIVGMWMSEIYNKVIVSSQKNKQAFELYFMDGPYYLKCRKCGDIVEISAIDDHNGATVLIENCRYIDILDELIRVAGSISKIGYYDSDHFADEFSGLATGIQRLKNELSKKNDNQ